MSIQLIIENKLIEISNLIDETEPRWLKNSKWDAAMEKFSHIPREVQCQIFRKEWRVLGSSDIRNIGETSFYDRKKAWATREAIIRYLVHRVKQTLSEIACDFISGKQVDSAFSDICHLIEKLSLFSSTLRPSTARWVEHLARGIKTAQCMGRVNSPSASSTEKGERIQIFLKATHVLKSLNNFQSPTIHLTEEERLKVAKMACCCYANLVRAILGDVISYFNIKNKEEFLICLFQECIECNESWLVCEQGLSHLIDLRFFNTIHPETWVELAKQCIKKYPSEASNIVALFCKKFTNDSMTVWFYTRFNVSMSPTFLLPFFLPRYLEKIQKDTSINGLPFSEAIGIKLARIEFSLGALSHVEEFNLSEKARGDLFKEFYGDKLAKDDIFSWYSASCISNTFSLPFKTTLGILFELFGIKVKNLPNPARATTLSLLTFLNSRHKTELIELIQAYLEAHPSPINFQEHFDEIGKIKTEHDQHINFSWLTTTLFTLREGLSNDQLKWVEEQKFIEQIMKLHIPSLRYPLTLAVLQAARANSNMQASPFPFCLFASWLEQQGADKATIEKFNEKFNSAWYAKYIIGHTPNLTIVLNALFLLIQTDELSGLEKTKVLNHLLSANNKKATQFYAALTIVLEFNVAVKLKNIDRSSVLSIAEEVFKEKIPIEDVTDFTGKYDKTFARLRNPQALMTFAAKMKTLDDGECLTCLAAFTAAVLNGEFPAVRYDTTNNPHLAKIDPILLEQWKKGLTIPLEEIGQDEEKQEELSMLEWLKNQLQDGHLPLANYPHLESFRDNPSVENAKALLEKIGEYGNEIERHCLLLVDPKEDKRVHLKALGNLLSSTKPELHRHIVELLEAIEHPKQTPLKGLKVVDTDNPYDLLLCGTEVLNSCQNVNGDPDYNRGLLGYLMNGQTRVVAIVDPKGTILARAICRCLLNGDGKEVIFIERFYFREGLPSQNYIKGLLHLVRVKANEMGVDVTTLNEEWRGNEYPSPLKSEGGPAPWEYCDAVGGVEVNGEFEIEKAYFLKE